MLCQFHPQVRYGMEDNKKRGSVNTQYDLGGPNDVRLPYNPCGCVYACDLDENYDCIRLYAEVCGIYTEEQDYMGRRNLGVCDVAGISEPDNVATMNGQVRLFLVAESANSAELVIVLFESGGINGCHQGVKPLK
jgi:hypothetical protein